MQILFNIRHGQHSLVKDLYTFCGRGKAHLYFVVGIVRFITETITKTKTYKLTPYPPFIRNWIQQGEVAVNNKQVTVYVEQVTQHELNATEFVYVFCTGVFVRVIRAAMASVYTDNDEISFDSDDFNVPILCYQLWPKQTYFCNVIYFKI